jgi:thiamine-monophosphate kinase
MYSEGELIQRILDRFGDLPDGIGIGDDAAVVNIPAGFSALLCSDLLAEGSHFRRGVNPPDSVGFKAVAANVSDIGAMGGIPRYCLLSLAVSSDIGNPWIDAFLEGVASACGEFKVRLAGGDTSAAERIFVDVSMMGLVETGGEVRRGGARAGDGIWVTGDLGGSTLGLARIGNAPASDPAVRRHLYPRPRHALGRRLAAHVTSMIDVSDGLSVDLTHILVESGVSARIERNRIPRAPGSTLEQALHGGEDYELIMTATSLPSMLEEVPITRIGEIVGDGSNRIVLVDGSAEEVVIPHGWQHFSGGG